MENKVQNQIGQTKNNVNFVLENERALARALKKAQSENSTLDVAEFTKKFAEQQITWRLSQAMHDADVEGHKHEFYVAWAYAWAKFIGLNIRDRVRREVYHIADNTSKLVTEIQTLLNNVDSEVTESVAKVEEQFGLQSITDVDQGEQIVQSEEFIFEMNKVQAQVYSVQRVKLMALLARAVKANDKAALDLGGKALEDWRTVCHNATESGWVDPAAEEFTAKVNQMQAIEINPNTAVATVSTPADVLSQAKELVRVALVHANEFIIVGTNPYLDAMHIKIKEVKALLSTVNINPKTLLADAVHKFLDSAEECADDGSLEEMNRIFYLVRGLGGTIGIKDQVEKRIGGIKNRAKKVAEKTQTSSAAPAVEVVQPQVVFEVATSQLVKC
jgi:hypothetical protein